MLVGAAAGAAAVQVGAGDDRGREDGVGGARRGRDDRRVLLGPRREQRAEAARAVGRRGAGGLDRSLRPEVAGPAGGVAPPISIIVFLVSVAVNLVLVV